MNFPGMCIAIYKQDQSQGTGFKQRFSADDLLRITEIAEKARAAVHISDGTTQFLIGLPERGLLKASKWLESFGYDWIDISNDSRQDAVFHYGRDAPRISVSTHCSGG